MELSVAKDNKYTVVTLGGRIEWEDARQLDQTIKGILDNRSYYIAFDLNKVSYICSAGIGALVYNLNTVKKNSGAISIISSNEYVDFMFETLKFDMIFEGCIYPSLEEFRRRTLEQQ